MEDSLHFWVSGRITKLLLQMEDKLNYFMNRIQPYFFKVNGRQLFFYVNVFQPSFFLNGRLPHGRQSQLFYE